MQQIQIIGNLGADAQIKQNAGEYFVTFRVAVTEKQRVGEEMKPVTTWYSCTYNKADSPVVQYLRTGQQVFIQGKPTYTMYDSAVHHCKMLDVRIFVNSLQLVGSPEKKDPADDNRPF